MNIAFNALSAKAGAGISSIQNLFPTLVEIDKKNRYFVIISRYQTDIYNLIPEGFNKIIVRCVPRNPFLRVIYEQIVLPFYLGIKKIDILYCAGNVAVILAPCKVLLHMQNADPFSGIIEWDLKNKIRNTLLFYLGCLSANRANRIQFNTKNSMYMISNFYNIKPDKCFVLPPGINFEYFNSEAKRSENDYILTVSVVAPNKNLGVLIKAFSLLKERDKYNGRLIIVGDIKPYYFYYKKLLKIIEEEGIRNEVIFTGRVEYTKINKYYQSARLFILPSLEETFGIPVIEAMYNEIAVLASDSDLYPNLFIPFKEIAEDRISYFDPYSVEDLYSKMKIILQNKKDMMSNREFIEKKYDIRKIAHRLIDEFKSLEGKQ